MSCNICEPLACAMFDMGYKASFIASTFGCSSATIRDRLRKYGKTYKAVNRRRIVCPCHVLCLRLLGFSMKKIADEVGCKSQNSIWRILNELEPIYKEAIKRSVLNSKSKIDEALKNHDTMEESASEIAGIYGFRQESVSRRIRKLGLPHKTREQINSERHEKAMQRIPESVVKKCGDNFTPLRRIDNYRYLLKCNKCCFEFERSPSYKSNITCDNCENVKNLFRKLRDERIENLKVIENRKKEHYRKINKINNPASDPIDRDKIINCKECGKAFRIGDVSLKKIPVYCSDKCRHKSCHRNSHHSRRERIKSTRNGFVYRKDIADKTNGLCYLCWLPLDKNDYKYVIGKDGRKAFIAGNNYPTIDHYKALANGGKHSDENLFMAHFYCNAIKSDNSYEEAVSKLKRNGKKFGVVPSWWQVSA